MTRLALALILLAFPAWGQTPCDQRVDIVKHLADKYGETLRVRGITLNSRVMELFASDKGTWTIIISYPNGWSCMTQNGEGFTLMPVTSQKAGHAL